MADSGHLGIFTPMYFLCARTLATPDEATSHYPP